MTFDGVGLEEQLDASMSLVERGRGPAGPAEARAAGRGSLRLQARAQLPVLWHSPRGTQWNTSWQTPRGTQFGCRVVANTPRGSPDVVETVMSDGRRMQTSEPPELTSTQLNPQDAWPLDGRWSTTDDDSLVRTIFQDKLTWADGGFTIINAEGEGIYSIELLGKRYYAEFSNDKLMWDDGDVWQKQTKEMEDWPASQASTRADVADVSL